jgi:CubicO group peptidase (beta-lactamase class C family)
MPHPDGPLEARKVTRRDLLGGAAVAAGALAALPALGVGRAGASPRALVQPSGNMPTPGGGTQQGLHPYILDRMQAAHLPSLAAAVVRDGDITWARGYGKADREAGIAADPDTVYMLASVSKTIICAAAMQLWEQGSLDLDADVNTYLPFPVRNPAYPSTAITARQLLTHTSSIHDRYSLWGTMYHPTPQGYCHGDPTISMHDLLAGYLVPGGPYFVAGQNFYGQTPGQYYHYSNIGADVAAYLVEVISGTDYDQFCKDNIFTPLGMTQTGYHLADITTPNLAMPYRYDIGAARFEPYYQYGYPDYPCGCLRTSATMLSRWLRCFMNYGELEGVRILKRTTVEEIRRPQIPGNWWQGLIFYYSANHGNPLIGHSGSDFGVATKMFFEADADRPKGVIMLANRYVTGWKAWSATQDIEARLLAMP